MQKLLAVLILAGGAVATGGCYHAIVETGATPSPTVIDQPWASGWVYGLIAPKTVTTTSQCPRGVAKVETEHSFVNSLVGMLTFGIYTPMHIRVTCAANRISAVTSGEVEHVAAAATTEEYQAVFTRAADDVAMSGAPVYVVIDQK